MGSVKTTVEIDIKTINPFEVKAKTKALNELAQLDSEVLVKLAELSKSSKAIMQIKTNFPMIKGFLSN
ncbi:hypothetical protein BC749_108155 [Flavobacterium araucananum]|jgi:hypothetical protein|uniref:Uncharacterized protein n=1 Tax=Flavobacterium araucananum TaxID=946678 RepID=A0A227NRW0_9FLAO|nr:hypothetical protein [Flavobacterium araucananum]OXG00013.1 hypothetical protein B0A64_20860 [Flavobacterium araucananum]PWJ97005.1 hypothetical protein BC749_108155 [Flavobacterium araucananum]